MKTSVLSAIHEQYRETQSLILHIVEELPAEQWSANYSRMGTPLAYHVWHIAREADLLHATLRQTLRQPAEQVWHRDRLASRWSFPPDALGLHETGIGMDEDDARRLTWPTRDALMSYMRLAFAEVNRTIDILGQLDTAMEIELPDSVLFGGASTAAGAIMRAVANGNRHLGIIGWVSTIEAPRLDTGYSVLQLGSISRHPIGIPTVVSEN